MSPSNNPAMTARVRPPRWVHVRFPRGAMFGEPGNRAKQRAVLRDTLDALAAIREPGGSLALPYRWEAPPVMWRGSPLRESSYS